MSGSLTEAEVARYHRDGFLFPLEVFDEAEAGRRRDAVEALERRYPAGSLPRDVGRYFRTNIHLMVPLAARIALDARVLNAVESVLGEDLMVWSCEFFIKEAGTPNVVTWHQDLTYWGLGETDEELTAWIALSPASVASGCMRFVAGSHHQAIQPHRDTFAENNLLSRGQEVAVEVEEADAVDVVLRPGQMSLHHGRMFHASGPNTSDDRRIGLVVRYITPRVRQLVGERDYAMLARGVDREGNFFSVAPPHEEFSASRLALYEQVLADQAVALTQGAEREVGLYT
jgi:hypothetical protein